MHQYMKALLLLGAPLALTLCDVPADAKKHHHKKDAEATDSAATPDKPAAADASVSVSATATAPAQPPAAGAAASVSVSATAAPPPGADASVSVTAPTAPPAGDASVSAASSAPPPPVATQAPPTSPIQDSVRFRGGVSVGGGGEFAPGITFGMFGVDGHIGVQIKKWVGIYVQPHFSLGSGTYSGVTGTTGTFAATLMVDATIIDRIFVGAGAGYGLLNNPNGPVIQFRVGGYPVMRRSAVSARRKGLMVGADIRLFVIPIPSANGTVGGAVVPQIMAAVGYEAY